MKQQRTAFLLTAVLLISMLTACNSPASPDDLHVQSQQEEIQEITQGNIPLLQNADFEHQLSFRPTELSVLQDSWDDKPVIFIADGGTGDGSSPDSPLKLEVSNNVFEDVAPGTGYIYYFFDSLLYQAFAKLYGTGGTIVICGEVKCDQFTTRYFANEDPLDMLLPYCGGAEIRLTSVYNGIDYRQTNQARLILQSPVSLYLNNPVTFENMDICTMEAENQGAANRTIYGCGMKTVFGKGINCIALDKNKEVIENPASDYYPTVSGGNRYTNLYDSTDLTIQSGTFYNVYATSSGLGFETYGNTYGSTHVTIEDDANILGTLSGTTGDNRGIQCGDINITINGGNFFGRIHAASMHTTGLEDCSAVVRINGGTFSDSAKIIGSYSNSKSKFRTSLLDFSGYSGDTSGIAEKAVGFKSYAPKANNATDLAIQQMPTKTQYFSGDLFNPAGMVLSMNYNDRDYLLNYDRNITAFSFFTENGTQLDLENTTLTSDMQAIRVCYDGVELGSISIQVLDRPEIQILGAAVKTNQEKQDLNFLVGVTADVPSGMELKDCGIWVGPADLIQHHTDITFHRVAGYEHIPGAVYTTGGDAYSTYTGKPSDIFSAAVTEIPREEYADLYTAIAYYTFTWDGTLHTAYSLPYTTSVYSLACSAQNAEDTAKAELLRENVVLPAENGTPSTYLEDFVQEKVQGTLAYFRKMAEFKWICPTDIDFSGDCEWTGGLVYRKGVEYSGFPYLADFNGMDNLESFSKHVDENGLYIGDTGWKTMHGNNCSSAVFQAISRFTNHYSYYDMLMFPQLDLIPKMKNEDAPVVPIGDFFFPHTSALTSEIIKANGETQAEQQQALYNAFAQSQAGDYLLSYWNNDQKQPLSHVLLISGVHVEYESGNLIDGANSYLLVYEQTSTMDPETNSTWGIDRKKSFDELYRGSYLPTRDAAFASGYFETPHCMIYNINTPENIRNGVTGEIVSNYDISEVELKIVNTKTGEIVLNNFGYTYNWRVYNVCQLDPDNIVKDLEGGYEYILSVSTANRKKEYVRFTF